MDEQDILDVPEADQESQLRFSFRLISLSIVACTLGCYLLFSVEFFRYLSLYDFRFSVLEVDLFEIAFLLFLSLGVYFFISFLQFEIQHWYRIMTVLISIIFVALVITILLERGLSPFFADWFRILRGISFVSIVGGGGCSIAVMFLRKKKYLIFVAIMICTIFLFSFVDKL